MGAIALERVTLTYPAYIHYEGEFGISFPDFPGCISVASTFEGALEEGAKALQFHIEGMVDDGNLIPSPSDVSKFQDCSSTDDAIIMHVEVQLPSRQNIMGSSRR